MSKEILFYTDTGCFAHPDFVKAVNKHVEEGYINAARHPELPLTIYNYTKKTQFEHHWNPITMKCRGLVIDDDNRVVIDPPRKFFNRGEPEAPEVDMTHVVAMEKLDGYYISIRYDTEYGLIVTSRGSFTSKYAQKARELLETEGISFSHDTDFFCELLWNFPEDTGIIVTRHEHPGLVCWGRDAVFPQHDTTRHWSGTIAKLLTEEEVEEYLKQEVEGVVLFNTETTERVKVKTDWYLAMHRAISGCSKHRVWEVLQGGGRLAGQSQTTYTGVDNRTHTINLAQIPEEHMQQMLSWEDELQKQYHNYLLTARYYEDCFRQLSDKTFATLAPVPPLYRSIVLAWRHQKDPTKQIWRAVKRKSLRNAED